MRNRLGLLGLGALMLTAQRGDAGVNVQSILGFILVGIVVGVIARLLVPGTGGMSWLVTVIVGIVGAVIGGWLAGAVFPETEGVDWLASILVAALLVWLVTRSGAFGRRRTL